MQPCQLIAIWLTGAGAPRRAVPLAVPAVVAVAWTAAVAAAVTGTAGFLDHDALFEQGPPAWAALALFLLAWQAMVAAMMLPSSLPMVRHFGQVAIREGRPPRAVPAFRSSAMVGAALAPTSSPASCTRTTRSSSRASGRFPPPWSYGRRRDRHGAGSTPASPLPSTPPLVLAGVPSAPSTKLPELLLVEILRGYLASAPAAERGWLAALRDPVLAGAMSAIHRSPERRWTRADLAAEATVSRSLLDARFRDVLGMSPIRYLTEWRMHVAKGLLSTSDQTVASIANRVGYESEEAFSRAFKRSSGRSPARWRTARSSNKPELGERG
jgi:AraC-like DNA-binding protein